MCARECKSDVCVWTANTCWRTLKMMARQSGWCICFLLLKGPYYPILNVLFNQIGVWRNWKNIFIVLLNNKKKKLPKRLSFLLEPFLFISVFLIGLISLVFSYLSHPMLDFLHYLSDLSCSCWKHLLKLAFFFPTTPPRLNKSTDGSRNNRFVHVLTPCRKHLDQSLYSWVR